MPLSTDHHKNIIREHVLQNTALTTLFGNLVIGSPIGEGGPSVVYEATTQENQSVKFAVKVLADNCAQGHTSRYKRFLMEYRAVIQLVDSGFVAVPYELAFLKVGGRRYPYIIYKRYAANYDAWRTQRGPFENWAQFKPTLNAILDAVEFVHSKGVIHRDIKPQNILMRDDERPILADFGIAHFDSMLYDRLVKTHKHDRLANASFSAPEQVNSVSPAHPTMDVFAIGQLIQWSIAGRTHHGTGRIPLASFDESFSHLDGVVDRCLRSDPANRPQSIKELRDMIDRGHLKAREISANNNIWIVLKKFGDVLAKRLPGMSGWHSLKTKRDVDAFLSDLSRLANKSDFQLMSNRYGWVETPPMRRISATAWLFNYMESQISELWVLRRDSDHAQCVLLVCAPMKPFRPGTRKSSYPLAEAAWFRGRYISRREHDDGYASIDGKIAKLNGKSMARLRILQRNIWVFGPRAANCAQPGNEDALSSALAEIEAAAKVTAALLAPLERLRPHPEV